jgi:hypothetical protein
VSVSNLEAFLARIYTDPLAREKFLDNPDRETQRAGLLPHECLALKQIDRTGLELMAASLERKKQKSFLKNQDS